jgi:hypothetical protein
VCLLLKGMCRAWCFGVEHCLRRLLSNPDNLADVQARAARTEKEPGTFYSSPQYRQLDKDCAGALSDPNVLTVLLSFGGDGVQMSNWGCRTATVIGLKCEDLRPERVQTGQAVAPLMVIEGEKEPAVLNHLLKDTADFFLKHCPRPSSDGEGLMP